MSKEYKRANPAKNKLYTKTANDKRTKEEKTQARKIFRARNPSYWSEWEARNRKKRNNQSSVNRKTEKGRLRGRAYKAARRAAKLQQTPPWLTEAQKKEIRDIYKNCPEGYHVDHIIPLKGKEVRGLHVPWNLQYLPAAENLKKGNRVI